VDKPSTDIAEKPLQTLSCIRHDKQGNENKVRNRFVKMQPVLYFQFRQWFNQPEENSGTPTRQQVVQPA
jgi:hypothetical protein